MKNVLFAAGLVALAAVPMAAPAFAQTVIVAPEPAPPPPPPSSTVIVTPPPQPTVSCAEKTTTTDRVIGSKTETSTECVHTR